MILGLFLELLTMDLPERVKVGKRTKDGLKMDSIQNAIAGILPLPPQEKFLLPHQKPVQGNQKKKQKKISKGNNDQE